MMSQNDDAKSHHFGMQYFLLEICCALTLMGQIFTPWMPRALGSYPYTCPYRYYIEGCPTSRLYQNFHDFGLRHVVDNFDLGLEWGSGGVRNQYFSCKKHLDKQKQKKHVQSCCHKPVIPRDNFSGTSLADTHPSLSS